MSSVASQSEHQFYVACPLSTEVQSKAQYLAILQNPDVPSCVLTCEDEERQQRVFGVTHSTVSAKRICAALNVLTYLERSEVLDSLSDHQSDVLSELMDGERPREYHELLNR